MVHYASLLPGAMTRYHRGAHTSPGRLLLVAYYGHITVEGTDVGLDDLPLQIEHFSIGIRKSRYRFDSRASPIRVSPSARGPGSADMRSLPAPEVALRTIS